MTNIATIIIAVMVAFIGLLQYLNSRELKLISEEKLKLDLFDRRFRVFESTKILFSRIIESAGEINKQDIDVFRFNTKDATFLFDSWISDYIKEIDGKALRLNTICLSYRSSLPESNDRNKLVKEQGELTEWFYGQNSELENKLGDYLRFKVLG